jgi:hypothetical protein
MDTLAALSCRSRATAVTASKEDGTVREPLWLCPAGDTARRLASHRQPSGSRLVRRSPGLVAGFATNMVPG